MDSDTDGSDKKEKMDPDIKAGRKVNRRLAQKNRLRKADAFDQAYTQFVEDKFLEQFGRPHRRKQALSKSAQSYYDKLQNQLADRALFSEDNGLNQDDQEHLYSCLVYLRQMLDENRFTDKEVDSLVDALEKMRPLAKRFCNIIDRRPWEPETGKARFEYTTNKPESIEELLHSDLLVYVRCLAKGSSLYGTSYKEILKELKLGSPKDAILWSRLAYKLCRDFYMQKATNNPTAHKFHTWLEEIWWQLYEIDMWRADEEIDKKDNDKPRPALQRGDVPERIRVRSQDARKEFRKGSLDQGTHTQVFQNLYEQLGIESEWPPQSKG